MSAHDALAPVSGIASDHVSREQVVWRASLHDFPFVRFPIVDTGVTNAVLAAQIGNRNAGLCSFKIPMILAKTGRASCSGPCRGPARSPTGLSPLIEVTAGAKAKEYVVDKRQRHYSSP